MSSAAVTFVSFHQAKPMHRTNLFTSQWMHDYVVRSVAAAATGYLVHANLHEGHGSFVGAGLREFSEISPDLLLCDPESFGVRHVIEVETKDSMTSSQVERWHRIAHSARSLPTSDFWILVPLSSVGLAVRLCRKHGVPARIGTWTFGPSGVTTAWGRTTSALTTHGPVASEETRAAFAAHAKTSR